MARTIGETDTYGAEPLRQHAGRARPAAARRAGTGTGIDDGGDHTTMSTPMAS
jgi:hypothetical protein